MAAETPSSTKKNVYIQPRSNWLQLQSVAVRACSVPSDFSAKVAAPCRALGQRLAVGPEERGLQRLPEHREAVGHADAQMDAEGGRRDQPAIEAGFGDDALSGEQRRAGVPHACSAGHGRSLPPKSLFWRQRLGR